MIPIADAEKILQTIDVKPEAEPVDLDRSLGRVLAEDIVSAIDMPPFDKSAMDGFAIHSGDDSGTFKIVETIAAGDVPQRRIGKGECARIMTGAMLPEGADRVVKKEVTAEWDSSMRITGQDPHFNVCLTGEDVRVGDRVLARGTLIRPQEVAVLASMGRDKPVVYRKPSVGILTTGSEIVEPGAPLERGQIYNSNAYSIAAQILQLGARVSYGGIAADEKENIRDSIAALFRENDMVIISGGVSMGDFDFVPAILLDLGVKLYFQKVAVKPGKPTVFGVLENKVLFGLPGNPVSTFVIFEIFVKPFLYRMMGYRYTPLFFQGEMKKDFKRKRNRRTAFIPVQYREGLVEVIEYHGSAHVHALSRANALLEIPAGVNEVPQGSRVNVRSI